MIPQLLWGKGALEIIIMQLGGGNRVVAVAYRVDKDAFVGDAVLFLHLLRGGQGGQRPVDPLGLLRGDKVAADAAAAHHQVEGIKQLHLVKFLLQRSKDGVFPVINQQHGVGNFQRGQVPDGKTGFDQALNDPLGSAHGGLRAGVKFILLQIDDTHQTAADLSVA